MNVKNISTSLLCLLLASGLLAKSKGAPPMSSGVPNQKSCMSSKCHGDFELNSGDAEIVIKGLPEKYVPGETYDIVISMSQSRKKAWGFQATVASADAKPMGQLLAGDSPAIQQIDPKAYARFSELQFITHTSKGKRGPKTGISPEWAFQWQAPAEAEGEANVYVALNAGNGNKKKTGDYIYTRSFAIPPAE